MAFKMTLKLKCGNGIHPHCFRFATQTMNKHWCMLLTSRAEKGDPLQLHLLY